MRTCRRAVTALFVALPLVAWGAVPVVENADAGGYSNSTPGGSAPPAGYGTNGAYAGGGASAPVSAQGQLFLQLQQMQEDIVRLRGQVEVQQNDIQRMKQEALERYQDLDSRISASNAPAAAGATPNSSAGGSVNAAGSSASADQAAPAASSEPGDPAKEKLYYDAAFDLIKAKDFDKASQAFAAFLRKYPNSQYSGNAQYWLGEVNLAKGDLQGAGQAFAKVSQLYPKHNKVPDSLYKLADVERRLGHADRVKGILQQVVSQYPGTSAAQLAQRDLQKM